MIFDKRPILIFCVDCKGSYREMAHFKFIAKQFLLSTEGYFESCH